MLAYPIALAAGCLGLIVASFFCYRALGSDLLPAMDEGGFILDYLMPAGSSLDDTNAVLLGVEKILTATQEVESTSRRTGLAAGPGRRYRSQPRRFFGETQARPRRALLTRSFPMSAPKSTRSIPQLDVEFVQVLQDMIGDLTNSPEPIEIKLFSPDPALLKQWGPKIGDKLKKLKGVADVKDGIENTISGPAIVMNVDPVVAARAGFSPQEIELDASAILQGEPATHARGCERSRLHHSRPLSAGHASHARPDPQHRDHQQLHRQDRDARLAGRVPGRSRANRNSFAKICSADIAVTGRFEGISLGKGMEMVQQMVAGHARAARHSSGLRRYLRRTAKVLPAIFSSCSCSP